MTRHPEAPALSAALASVPAPHRLRGPGRPGEHADQATRRHHDSPAAAEAPASERRTPTTTPSRRSRSPNRCARASSAPRSRWPATYTPSAPTGVGTDDYRCFLLDPELDEDAWLTGTQVLPGQPRGRAPRDPVPGPAGPRRGGRGEGRRRGGARAGPASAGPASTASSTDLTTRPGSAPGRLVARRRWCARRLRRLARPGSRIVMQVHYNLLAGQRPDTSARLLRWRRGNADLTPLAHHADARAGRAAVPPRTTTARSATATRRSGRQGRFGEGPELANLLHLLCGTNVYPAAETRRLHPDDPAVHDDPRRGGPHAPARPVDQDRGQPRTPRARTILDIPIWDFDNQGAKPIEPVQLDAGDTVRVTCHHEQGLRDMLPAFDGQQEATSCGARAPPTRCASASCRSSSTTKPSQVQRRPAASRRRPRSPNTTSSAQAVIRSGLLRRALAAKSSSAPSGTWWVSPSGGHPGRWPPGNQGARGRGSRRRQ